MLSNNCNRLVIPTQSSKSKCKLPPSTNVNAGGLASMRAFLGFDIQPGLLPDQLNGQAEAFSVLAITAESISMR
jgi:hypothetical protein